MASRLVNYKLFPHTEGKIQEIVDELALTSATDAVKLAVQVLYELCCSPKGEPFAEGPFLKRVRAGDNDDRKAARRPISSASPSPKKKGGWHARGN